jgi:hypothetical protein
MTTYTALHMEAALCIWEEMLDERERKGPAENERPWKVAMRKMWHDYGTVSMRHEAIRLGPIACEVYDIIGCDRLEELDLIPYDWEFIPAFVARVDWSGRGIASADAKDIARQLDPERVPA